MHRLITRSAAYRLASTTAFTSRPGEASADANGIASTSANGDGEKNLSKDPENRWIWRRTPMRLESQAVRDSILSLAGSLDATIGGPTVPQAQQPSSKRRSLYFFHSNNERNLFLTMFDEALVKECYRRDQSIVPQQALALSNSQLVLDAAKPISERILVDIAANDDDAYIRQAFRLLLGTAPNDDEIAASRQALAAWKTLPEGPRGEAAAAQARANLIWVLLNHNDFVTVR